MRNELFVAAVLAAFAWGIAAPSHAETIRGDLRDDGATFHQECGSARARKQKKRMNSIAAKQKRTAEEKLVERSIDMINGGTYGRAIATLYGAFGAEINSWALNATAFTQREHEIVLIVAIAVLRSEGQHKRDSTAGVTSAAEQRANLRWAIIAVDGLAFVNYAEDRHVAEAWARDPATHDAARNKLWGLYQKSRLSSDAQFVVLAKLLRAAGRDDDAARVLATSRETVK